MKYIATISHYGKNGMFKAGQEVPNPSPAHIKKGLVKEVKVKEPKETKVVQPEETKAKTKSKK